MLYFLSDSKSGKLNTEPENSERQAGNMYRIQYVYGHYQVYTVGGRFLFSADTEAEAMEELEALDA